MNGLFSSKDDGCMPSLSMTQRMYGFGGCFLIGGLMSLLSSFSLMHGDIPQFALLYSLGNVIALLSTGFGMWPTTDEDRSALLFFFFFFFFCSLSLSLSPSALSSLLPL
jgi:hypothetical protein